MSKTVHWAEHLNTYYEVENFCRKGPWEEACRDRHRFLRRIRTVESVLKPVLDNHRRQIFNNILKTDIKQCG